MVDDTIPVRSGEELNLSTLEDFLRKNVLDLPNEPLELQQFSTGYSNLTYQLKMGEWEAVLRRPPLGPVAPKAHDMKREHHILSSINPYFQAAPEPILFSDDDSIVGSPFFLMERKHGVVIDSKFPEGVEPTSERCRQLSYVMVNQLADLHSIPYEKTGLAEISKPEGFIERQVHGWISRYERAKTDEIEEVGPLIDYLQKNIPQYSQTSIIHYDYKINNAMFNQNLSEMVGLFDWEMSTVGDPLADLGVALSYWTESSDPELIKFGLGQASVTTLDGFLTRQEFIEAYAVRSGRNVSNIDFYLTFGYFKLAVILQQIYYRYKKGQTNDLRFSKLGITVKSLITHAAHVAAKEA
ncbi:MULTISPECIES: phosphotransferase family protein [unclassified Peribacillus]|uniref:phosphotransferase family protein n=1 Tax=unclassified Peribacillus TaxID=2675266 RepID=UPI001914C0FF|nr:MULTISPECIES: phosphotransferase family protein [unclassified Peribacillus]MBK5445677.1 phosphotransferase family protein [Peribacillus sp. TH24]MBK5459607.1 phosphotransferase family protein [Peribacillus sp. TH27]MBK5497796.1 phosphotransferase family protein [Peribacillus sp. TH14]WMX57076.1 phosphotransferase family protein [Peribacillus sp. R9-11]